MSMIGAGAVALSLGYLILTLAFQIRPLGARFPLLDRLGILPRWKFFTQGNATYDVGIEVQDRSANGRLGGWSPIDVASPRRLRSSLWHPERYRAGVLWLAIETVERRAAKAAEIGPDTSRAYAILLNHCRDASARAADFEARRFAVVRTRRAREGGERWVTFTSNFHTF